MGAVLSRRWRGFALPVALLAMIGSGIIVTAGFAAVQQGSAVSESDLSTYALQAAELGLERALAGEPEALASAGTSSQGQPVTVYRNDSGSVSVTYTIRMWDVSDTETLIRSEGRVTADGSEVLRTVESMVPAGAAPLE